MIVVHTKQNSSPCYSFLLQRSPPTLSLPLSNQERNKQCTLGDIAVDENKQDVAQTEKHNLHMLHTHLQVLHLFAIVAY